VQVETVDRDDQGDDGAPTPSSFSFVLREESESADPNATSNSSMVMDATSRTPNKTGHRKRLHFQVPTETITYAVSAHGHLHHPATALTLTDSDAAEIAGLYVWGFKLIVRQRAIKT
jgi:hypothetical protein